MWLLSKEFKFEAAHQLPCHDGKCARLHGHSWVMWVHVGGATLVKSGAKAGMLIDYSELKSLVKPLVDDYLDHHYLNQTLELENPTSEAIAQWIYRRLSSRIDGLYAVEIRETCTSRCLYLGATDLRDVLHLGGLIAS